MSDLIERLQSYFSCHVDVKYDGQVCFEWFYWLVDGWMGLGFDEWAYDVQSKYNKNRLINKYTIWLASLILQ